MPRDAQRTALHGARHGMRRLPDTRYASWNKFGGGEGSFSDDPARGIKNVPGFEFAGTIEAVGRKAAADGFAVGDEVFGVTLFGAYSSRVR